MLFEISYKHGCIDDEDFVLKASFPNKAFELISKK